MRPLSGGERPHLVGKLQPFSTAVPLSLLHCLISVSLATTSHRRDSLPQIFSHKRVLNGKEGFIDLLSEELKLKEAEAQENQRHADMALLEAKKKSSQYQKEADKCNSGMDTCEEAREKAESALEAQKNLTDVAAQKNLTAMWQHRAIQRGWKEPCVKLRAHV
uniref:Uncharacterized protein n=1 Tax=Fagus sylvatica TaxID=28930 RepID=A0A2N9IHZ6_FAGSY